MGRHYAGVLGFLAFTVLVARGLLRAGGIEATIEQALWGMAGFALVGYLAGEWAGWIVGDGVKSRFATEMAAAAGERPPTSRPTT